MESISARVVADLSPDETGTADKTAVSDAAIATPPAAGETEAWRKLASTALDAMLNRPVQFSAEEREAFVSRMRESVAGLEGETETSQILITAGSLAQAIEQYNGQAQGEFDRLIANFREVTRFLAGLAAGLPPGLARSLEAALALAELPALAGQLVKCVEALGSALPLRAASSPTDTPPSDAPAPSTFDACTGLPTRPDAEAMIQRAMSGTAQVYVAALYVHRMNLINARFGDAIGNQVILFCSQHIATNLSGHNDALFRWRGPGFVAVLERNESQLAVASEVQRFTSVPLSRFFETPSRTVYLPIKLTAEVIPTAGKTVEEVIEQVQKSLHVHGAMD